MLTFAPLTKIIAGNDGCHKQVIGIGQIAGVGFDKRHKPVNVFFPKVADQATFGEKADVATPVSGLRRVLVNAKPADVYVIAAVAYAVAVCVTVYGNGGRLHQCRMVFAVL